MADHDGAIGSLIQANRNGPHEGQLDMNRSETGNAPGELTPGASKSACNLGTAGPKISSFGQGFQAPNQPPAYAPADHYREYLEDVLDHISEYVNIAKSSLAVRDDRILAYALRIITTCGVAGVETTGNLRDAVAADKRLKEFCRSDSSGARGHDG